MSDSFPLQNVPLFRGLEEGEMQSVLQCLSANVRDYPKGETIFHPGCPVKEVGLVLEGQVHLVKEDRWGNTALLSTIPPGELFGESYACAGAPLPLRATAAECCRILFLNMGKMLTTCSPTCRFHARLLENLLSILAGKNLFLAQKADILAQRTVREKLLNYLYYQSQMHNSSCFTIPLNRQQLADYLSVDRSSMTVELGKLSKEGVLKVERNKFELL
ncbi:transcriptional activator FtrB [Eubacteriaceae bacterium CHKCI005]|uniref:Crp/Fnr family transcriptional regulator n=1 Tax=Solibaculum mannosilyticum TaxID=2780922 RepID=A0A7I8CZH8_9FIRM|nr:Crp/Fnr family transcriptional regulator [Solibaculum mannosilyticum]BCI59897.1 Crp/Fnr family transcriptional regulator [Solibaculum mannosilyticum]CZT56606.1 transcriptional activator FtrB [Eubacteriaceae bacterium CHKCI005]